MVLGGKLFEPVSPTLDKQGISPWALNNLSIMSAEEVIRATSGLGQRIKLEANPAFIKGDCENVLRSVGGNAFLIVGRDRPAGLLSGYGGLLDNRACSAIRLTAGMGGKDVRDVSELFEPLGLNPSNQKDAATIYLSQKTDIDRKDGFNCAAGTIGTIDTRSAIAMKADSIRIISVDGGIKFITSANSYNSQGGKVDQYADINFICGNDDSLLQPIVKGTNLRIVIDKIFGIMKEMCVTINQIVLQQSNFNIAIKSHTHMIPMITIPPMSTMPGAGTGAVLTTGNPVTTTTTATAVVPPSPFAVGPNIGGTPGFTELSAPLEAAGVKAVNTLLNVTTQRIVAHRNKIWAARKNATINNNSKLYLLSKNVHST